MKKIYMIIIVIFLFLFLTGCSSSKSSKKVNTVDDHSKEASEQEGATVTEDFDRDQLYSFLSKYGVDIFKNKQYENYPKKNGMFFISLKQLQEDFSIDISIYKGSDGTFCDVNQSGIFFDLDNVLNLEYNDNFMPILPTLIGCSFDEMKK